MVVKKYLGGKSMAKKVSFDVVENYIYKEEVKEDVNNGKRRKMLIGLVAKNELSQRQKVCISMYYADNIKMSEIAKELGITKSTVSKHIKKAKLRIEKYLKYSDIFMRL